MNWCLTVGAWCAIVSFSLAQNIKLPSHCATFYCPENCNVTYINGCPFRCQCPGYTPCPRVSCPAQEPICSIHTLLDGCQTCACKLPYAVVEKPGSAGQEPSENFVFLDGEHFNDQIKDRQRRHERVVQKYACTLKSMKKIDDCMHDMSTFHSFMKSKRRSQDSNSNVPLNPMLSAEPDDMNKMCDHMGNALKCIGSDMYKECRRAHPHLAEMDALYGYPCGPKQELYMHHMKCVHDNNRENYRTLACEDALARSMVYIENSRASLETKRRRKCDAMTWLMNCEKPAVNRLCSHEAGQVYVESLESMTDYMAPECTMDMKREVFEPKDGQEANSNIPAGGISLMPKEELQCTPQMHEEIRQLLGSLHAEVLRVRERASLAYPIGFWYKQNRIHDVCTEYQTAMDRMRSTTKNRCYKRNEMFDTIHYALHFPCGYASRGFFLTHFPCLTRVRKETELRECEFLAHQRFEDPSNDVCETYNILADCMYDKVVEKCGYDAMEVEYQYMNLVAQKRDPNCHIRRIFRFVETEVTTPRPTPPPRRTFRRRQLSRHQNPWDRRAARRG